MSKEKREKHYGNDFESVGKFIDRYKNALANDLDKEIKKIDKESRFLEIVGQVRNRKFSYRNPPRRIKGKHSIQEDAEKVNPLRGTEMGIAKNNCILCSIAYDMRRRNFDVQAKMSSKAINRSLIESIYGVNIDEQKYNVASHSFKGFEDKMLKRYKNGSRGILIIDGSLYGTGHVMNFEIDKGRVILVDGQKGRIFDVAEFSKRGNYSPRHITAIKTDDVPINYAKLNQACFEVVPEKVEHSEIKTYIEDVLMSENKDAIIHYGVPGMEWGVTRKKKDIGSNHIPAFGDVRQGKSNSGKTPAYIKRLNNRKNPGQSQIPSEDTTGRYGRGNIDLNNRKVVKNKDGSISTERSFSVNIDGKETLLPTVVNGKILSEDEAVDHYFRTGEHLGRFDTVKEAEAYAEKLHNRQDWYYNTYRPEVENRKMAAIQNIRNNAKVFNRLIRHPFTDVTHADDFLCHHGIIGQQWGVRRFQNKDRTLTSAGRERYRKSSDDDKEKTEAGKKSSRQVKKEAKEASKPESATWKSKDVGSLSDEELNKRNSRLQREKQYVDLTTPQWQKNLKRASIGIITALTTVPLASMATDAIRKAYRGEFNKFVAPVLGNTLGVPMELKNK